VGTGSTPVELAFSRRPPCDQDLPQVVIEGDNKIFVFIFMEDYSHDQPHESIL
jgi:hypothetical protein